MFVHILGIVTQPVLLTSCILPPCLSRLGIATQPVLLTRCILPPCLATDWESLHCLYCYPVVFYLHFWPHTGNRYTACTANQSYFTSMFVQTGNRYTACTANQSYFTSMFGNILGIVTQPVLLTSFMLPPCLYTDWESLHSLYC